MVVEVGLTTTEPVEVAASLPMPLSKETVVAPVVTHERVDGAPEVIDAGDAVKEEMTGARAFGITAFEGEEAAEGPAAFVAVTVKVYAWPFTRPGTTTGLPVLVAEMLLGSDVAV